jgi:TrmH family RNA methyltransferase
MGTIIRLADWFGIKHILCSKDCVDVYNPKVVQASMGSIARVAVHYVVLKDVISDYGLPLVGAIMTGESLQSFQFPDAGIIIIGNEGKGIRQEIGALLTNSITIPSFGGAESLNAATATSIILWELKRG